MGHLDRNERVIEAKLTDIGRKRLAEDGGIEVTQFALADDEVDYETWNENVPREDAAAVIEALPTYEAFTDETQSMRYKLITLEEDINKVPQIVVAQENSSIDLDEGDAPAEIGPITEFDGENTGLDRTLGYTAILQDDSIATLEAADFPNSSLTSEPDVPNPTVPALYGQKQRIDGSSITEVVAAPPTDDDPAFTVEWNGDDLTSESVTTLTIIGNETGLTLDIEVTIRPSQ